MKTPRFVFFGTKRVLISPKVLAKNSALYVSLGEAQIAMSALASIAAIAAKSQRVAEDI